MKQLAWSATQARRLKELGALSAQQRLSFQTSSERDAAFQRLAGELVRRERRRLEEFRVGGLRPRVCRLESRLTEMLTGRGFVQVNTPVIMARSHLAKMAITAEHPLIKQVYWLDRNRCLRPMLAPHLYNLLQNLLRLWAKPVRLFEVGPCFRREGRGAQHAAEFTMLNLVEAGLPLDEREGRLRELAAWVAEAAGLADHHVTPTRSEVYGDTIDILAGERRIEVGSAAMGPHALDKAWRITDTWVGIGFGLERLVMASENAESLGRLGRSLAYLDGIRLNI
ncbi:MAG: pyrrolysine--tRNA(Pyl) ligase large subunit [Desulfobacterales bacterium]|nr:pyrrolysine--tRNA(Pyl) ligase large subunit [Desulfobacterales bacterium]